MQTGQFAPMEFIVNRAIAAKENVDSATATRVAMLASLMGGGVMGAVIARQLARREVVPAAVPVRPPSPNPDTDATGIDQVSQDLQSLLRDLLARGIEEREELEARIDALNKSERKRNEALKELCTEIGGLVEDGYKDDQEESRTTRGRKTLVKKAEPPG